MNFIEEVHNAPAARAEAAAKAEAEARAKAEAKAKMVEVYNRMGFPYPLEGGFIRVKDNPYHGNVHFDGSQSRERLEYLIARAITRSTEERERMHALERTHTGVVQDKGYIFYHKNLYVGKEYVGVKVRVTFEPIEEYPYLRTTTVETVSTREEVEEDRRARARREVEHGNRYNTRSDNTREGREWFLSRMD